MLVAKFDCPACEAPLTPAAPLPSGKKIKCPKCTRVIVVPSPEDDVEEFEEEVDTVEEVEEVAPVRKRSRPSREEVEEERPSRRRAAREDEEDEEEERPSRRRAEREEDEDEEERPRKPKKKSKQKARGGSGLKIALFAGLGLLLLGGAGIGVYFLVTKVGGNPQVHAFDDATSILAGVTDQASAQAARPALVAVGTRLKEIHERHKAELKKGLERINQDPAAIQRAIDEAMRNPAKAQAEMERIEAKKRPMKEAAARMAKEAARVNRVPGGKELLAAFWDAWGEEGKMMSFAVAMGEKVQDMQKATPANYQQVRVGMTEKQVTDLLGKPIGVDTSRPGIRSLAYAAGTVEVKDGKVIGKSP